MPVLSEPANLDLPLFESKAQDPNVQWLVDVLNLVRDWMTAAELSTASAGRLDDRQIRSLASATPMVISGQKGYRHLSHATAEEIDRAAAWMESQGKQMIDRALAIRKRAHQMIG